MVEDLDRNADRFQVHRHAGAEVVQRVGRRNREVAALVGGLVAEVRAFLATAVPATFDRIDHVAGAVRAFGETDLVEDEELGLGAEVGRVTDAGRLQVLLGLGRRWCADPSSRAAS